MRCSDNKEEGQPAPAYPLFAVRAMSHSDMEADADDSARQEDEGHRLREFLWQEERASHSNRGRAILPF